MNRILRRLGPGLLYAGAAVGVSHLVQSTRAGASYGIIMVLVVILANLIKYPFFKAGPLFAAATGKSLLEAFFAKGKWAIALFYLVTLTTIFAVQAVVTLITASVLSSIFEINIPLWQISAVLLLLCGIILLKGKYHLLDRLMKSVIILLTITTIVTLIAAFFSTTSSVSLSTDFDFGNHLDVFFLIALIGWMPAPLDISLWHSEWTLAEAEDKNVELNIQSSTFDFKIGYWGTTFLAASFVALGAIILKGSEQELSASGAVFAGQIIGMYTQTLGSWTFAFVALAAFTTMFSTTLTVLDAYPRILQKAAILHNFKLKKAKYLYLAFLLFTIGGALFVLIFQLQNMKQLVDFATTISFLTAPILASLIYSVVHETAKEIWTYTDKLIAYLGLAFLYLFSFYFLYTKFI